MDEGRRIPPFAEDTLALLTEAVGGTGEELPRDEAISVITDIERFTEAYYSNIRRSDAPRVRVWLFLDRKENRVIC